MSGADGDDVKLHMLAEDQQDGKSITKKKSHTVKMFKLQKLFCFDIYTGIHLWSMLIFFGFCG